MASITTQSVTLSRLHRDGVREHISLLMGVDGGRLEVVKGTVDREDPITAIRHLPLAVRILDQLDWQQTGDRDSYKLELDDDLAAFMEELGRQADEMSECDLDQAAVDAAHIVKTAIGEVAA